MDYQNKPVTKVSTTVKLTNIMGVAKVETGEVSKRSKPIDFEVWLEKGEDTVTHRITEQEYNRITKVLKKQ